MKTGTIPRFPRFVRVGFTVRQEINEFTGRFKSYSDFNFVNLLSWNNNDDMAVSWLNANLVFRFRDYTSGAVFYSFIGNNEVVQTAQALLDFAGQQGHDVSLKLIPEDCVSDIAKSNNLLVSEDPDNHDYILSVKTLAEIKGRKQEHTREQVNRFKKNYGEVASFTDIDINSEAERGNLWRVFETRESYKTENDTQNEMEALNRLLENWHKLNLRAYGLKVEGKLEAFIICEVPDSSLPAVAHFSKANTVFKGIYHYLMHSLGRALQGLGCELLNIEQDLGIPGLRAAKQLLRPIDYYRKYTVKYADPLAIGEPESAEDVEQTWVGEVGTVPAGTID